MIDPQKTDIGRRVIYTGNRYPGGLPEVGVITSYNPTTVFVRYGVQNYSAPTSREDLEWEQPMTQFDDLPPIENPDLLSENEVSDGINVIIGNKAVVTFPMECRAQVEHLIKSVNRLHRQRLRKLDKP